MTALLERPAPVSPTQPPTHRSRTSRWRPAVRMAWRDIRHSPGRSVLVVLLIALPVCALSAADVLTRTMQLSDTEKVARVVGNAQAQIPYFAAPASLSVGTIGNAVEQEPDGLASFSSSPPPTATTEQPPPKPVTTQVLLSMLPAGARLVSSDTDNWTITTRYGITAADVSDSNYHDHLSAPLVRQLSGRAPAAPGEMAISADLAHTIGRGIGDTVVNTKTGSAYRVVGIIKDRFNPHDETAYVAPGTMRRSDSTGGLTVSYFVDSAGPVTWPMILKLNRVGVTVISRYVAAHPPARADVPFYNDPSFAAGQATSATGITTAALLAAMVMLEIVLLAGPAFAVGARRMRRSLGLLAAVGGARQDLRNVVLAGGILLGLAAGVAGLGLGVAAGLALLPLYAHWQNAVPGHIDLRMVELGGIVAVSVLTGLVAAWLPARNASRTDVLDALRGRRGTTRTRRALPIAGAVAAAGGAATAIGGAAATGNQTVLLAGAIVAELGLIACTPALIGGIGRAARWLPLSGRIALRDTVRNRSAATSAVAAIMAAVTGGVAVSILVASIDARDRAAYVQALPMHHGYLALDDGQNLLATTTAADVVGALRRALPGTSVSAVNAARTSFDFAKTTVSAVPRVTQSGASVVYGGFQSDWPSLTTDDGSHIDAIAGASVPAAAAALRAGHAVVFDRADLRHGYLYVDVNTGTQQSASFHHVLRRIAAVLVQSPYRRVDAVVPPAVLARWHVPIVFTGVLVATDHAIPSAHLQAAQAALARLGIQNTVYVEDGYQQQYRVGLIALLGASGFIALAAALIATILATVDSRPDLQTLGAIGASPRVRRNLSAARAAVISGIGCGLGVACGFVAPLGYLGVRNALAHQHHEAGYQISIPWWPNIIGALALLPLLATAGGFLFSRSRLPSERSSAT